jgi:hypothetical protein
VQVVIAAVESESVLPDRTGRAYGCCSGGHLGQSRHDSFSGLLGCTHLGPVVEGGTCNNGEQRNNAHILMVQGADDSMLFQQHWSELVTLKLCHPTCRSGSGLPE